MCLGRQQILRFTHKNVCFFKEYTLRYDLEECGFSPRLFGTLFSPLRSPSFHNPYQPKAKYSFLLWCTYMHGNNVEGYFSGSQASESPVDTQKRKKPTVSEVFNTDEEEVMSSKKRKLVPLDYSEEEKAAIMPVSNNKPASAEEKRKCIKNLIERIPTAKEELFAYKLDWTMVDAVGHFLFVFVWVVYKFSSSFVFQMNSFYFYRPSIFYLKSTLLESVEPSWFFNPMGFQLLINNVTTTSFIGWLL